MHSVQEIHPRVFWVGGNDRRLERFENLFPLPDGVSYNAYMIMDEKTALLDTVDTAVGDLFLQNVAHVLGEKSLDYLVINHMEPDHGAYIEAIVRRYPDVQLVGNAMTFKLIDQYFRPDLAPKRVLVKEGQEIALGAHTLRFHTAPMVHWPEVMMTYETTQGILFSADAFGSFGALCGNLFADEVDFEHAFLDEARRYYANIVGRYGAQVQAVLNKLRGVPLTMICPLHGLIWRRDLHVFIDKYDKWSRYEAEKAGVVLAYGSMYGHTENVMNALANKLAQRGVCDMHMYDVSKVHPSYIISQAWKYSHLVLGAPTYNMNLYFPMETLLHELAVLNLKNRKVALVGNHSWAGAAIKRMQAVLSGMEGMDVMGTPLDLLSSFKADEEVKMDELADAIAASVDSTKTQAPS